MKKRVAINKLIIAIIAAQYEDIFMSLPPQLQAVVLMRM
jgi:hypothetical protein